jgi:hypothetical protein
MMGPTLPILLVAVPFVVACCVIIAGVAGLFARVVVAVPAVRAHTQNVRTPRESAIPTPQPKPRAATVRPAPQPMPRAATEGALSLDSLLLDLKSLRAPAVKPIVKPIASRPERFITEHLTADALIDAVVEAVDALSEDSRALETRPVRVLAHGSQEFPIERSRDFDEEEPTVVFGPALRDDSGTTDVDHDIFS